MTKEAMLLFDNSVQRTHIEELRRQNAALLAENNTLRKRLDAWPKRWLEHMLTLREKLKRIENEIH